MEQQEQLPQQEETKAKEKANRGSYYVVHRDVNGDCYTTEFRNKRCMEGALSNMKKVDVVSIFKGRELKFGTKQVFTVDV